MAEAAKAEIIPLTSQIPAQHPASVANDPMIAIIDRASRDPSVDIGKLRELMAMRLEVAALNAKKAFANAMKETQTKMRRVAADANNPQTKSKYATYPALDKALRPIYNEHGFSLTFDTGDGAPDSMVRVVCDVMHDDGHSRSYHIDMPADGKGAKGGEVMTRTHATGSAVTYGKRYLLTMIFNIVVGDEEDDDGNAASGTEYISEAQAAELKKLIEDSGGDVAKFCEFAKVDKLGDIYANRFEAAKAAIERAAEQRKAAKK